MNRILLTLLATLALAACAKQPAQSPCEPASATLDRALPGLTVYLRVPEDGPALLGTARAMLEREGVTVMVRGDVDPARAEQGVVLTLATKYSYDPRTNRVFGALTMNMRVHGDTLEPFAVAYSTNEPDEAAVTDAVSAFRRRMLRWADAWHRSPEDATARQTLLADEGDELDEGEDGDDGDGGLSR